MVNNSFKKDYDNGMDSSFYIPFGSQGHPTAALGPRAAQQVAEMGLRLNAGLKNVEAGPVDPATFEKIPKQHYDEMRRLAKLTESNPSFHAPLVDPAGFQQNNYREGQREQTESQLKDVIERAYHMWVNPETGKPIDDKPIRINLHSANDAQAFLFNKDEGLKFYEDEKDKNKNYIKTLGYVNKVTGEVRYINAEEKYVGEEIEGAKRYESPFERLKEQNDKAWDQLKLELKSRDLNKQLIEDRLNDQRRLLLAAVDQQRDLGQEPLKDIDVSHLEGVDVRKLGFVQAPTKDVAKDYLNLKYHEKNDEENLLQRSKDAFEIYLKNFKPETDKDKEIYSGVKQDYASLIKNLQAQKQVEKEMEQKYKEQIYREKDPIKRYENFTKMQIEINNQLKDLNVNRVSSEDFANLLDFAGTPKIFEPIEDFALDKSARTFSNVALHAIDQAKGDYNKAPVITIENWTPELPFSRGESLKKLVDASRDELTEKLKKERGFTETEAKKAAEAVLGATWDVGHIYQLKKYGFDKEDVIKETEEIAKSLKHVHLTDNFGYSDSHLALGMGTVPIKEMVQKIKDAGYKDKYIIESGAFAAEFRSDPSLPSAEFLNSPLYTYSDNNPTWEATRDIYQSYFPGFGDILPETHFRQLYGSGFSQLPKELGGPQQGDRSRFSGNPLT